MPSAQTPLVAFKLMHDEDGADQWSLGGADPSNPRRSMLLAPASDGLILAGAVRIATHSEV